MTKTTPLGVRVNSELKAALDQAAHDDMRSTASLVNKVLTEWVVQRGLMSKDDAPAPVRRVGRPRTEATRADAAIASGPIIPWVEQVIGEREQITIGEILAKAAAGSRVSARSIGSALHGLGWSEIGGDGDAPVIERVWRR
ncbi:hypothetical protein [Sphingomonas sp.]|uniref:hypothetical protein n=1 Tax=Sphingomonas sp. TaxID=28214 RepID=UPI0025DBC70D|nr:hypothetical protein [Sphingomonas sp.]